MGVTASKRRSSEFLVEIGTKTCTLHHSCHSEHEPCRTSLQWWTQLSACLLTKSGRWDLMASPLSDSAISLNWFSDQTSHSDVWSVRGQCWYRSSMLVHRTTCIARHVIKPLDTRSQQRSFTSAARRRTDDVDMPQWSLSIDINSTLTESLSDFSICLRTCVVVVVSLDVAHDGVQCSKCCVTGFDTYLIWRRRHGRDSDTAATNPLYAWRNSFYLFIYL